MKNVFPHRVYCRDHGTWVNSPVLARMIWNRIRKPNQVWYCTDFEIISPVQIRLFVYDIANTFSGGIGEKILDQEITDFTAEEQALLNQHVLEVYSSAASLEYDRREANRVSEEILKIRKELFGV